MTNRNVVGTDENGKEYMMMSGTLIPADTELRHDHVAVVHPKGSEEHLKPIKDCDMWNHVREAFENVWIVDERYYFYPLTGKWRAKGRAKVYRSKGFKDFMERFFDGPCQNTLEFMV